MKKLFSLFTQGILVSSFSFSINACYNPLVGNGNNDGSKLPDPIVKDIIYYQALIEKTESYIKDCKKWIKDIEAEREEDSDGNLSDEEYQLAIDQLSAELFTYQSEINEYQFQILFLEKNGDKFTLEQILQGINIAIEKIINLEQTLKLKEKYPDSYSKVELENIKNEIKTVEELKEMFLKFKEEEENKCDN